MLSAIALAMKLGVPARFAKAAVIAALVAMILIALWGGKHVYDHGVIDTHEARQEAKNATADRKADSHAAEQRRSDDARSTSEAAEIKEAINEAGNDPAARRSAYYACVSKQQAARRERKPTPDC